MDEDRTSLSGTHSNDTIIELTKPTSSENDTKAEKDVSDEEDDPSTKKSSAGPSLEEGRAAVRILDLCSFYKSFVLDVLHQG